MAAHLKKRVYEEFSKVVQLPQEEAPAKKLRLTKPSNSMEAEGVVCILLEHYYKEQDNSVRLKIASLIGLLSKTQNFSPESILDDTLNTEKFHQVLAQLLDTLLVIGTQLPESPTVRHRLIEVGCKRKRTAHERARELYASGESKEKMDTSAVNLIASGGLRSLCSRTGGRDVRDLQRLGKLQTELAGAADFSATYLHRQLLLS
ncbi:integrator complex subunit 4-like isoform X2 [Salvelinus fontinalis]|uniref:integrator complex subunit 4-like isoform X2 n=1 Tax=Salvelinus fontinalis TaxID=8038 RepID=UPI002485CCC5|nr:integrator complex subunit 4-like isoform X2 [Salvelinus fontinalis]